MCRVCRRWARHEPAAVLRGAPDEAMYEQFYSLDERPFDLSPNPRFLFLSAKHREALSNLRYGRR